MAETERLRMSNGDMSEAVSGDFQSPILGGGVGAFGSPVVRFWTSVSSTSECREGSVFAMLGPGEMTPKASSWASKHLAYPLFILCRLHIPHVR